MLIQFLLAPVLLAAGLGLAAGVGQRHVFERVRDPKRCSDSLGSTR